MNTSDSRLHHKITISSWEGYNPSSLFRNNVWKLHGLPKSVVLDRGPKFVTELNKMLGIKTKLLTLFHLQIDSQTERINQELK